jgi:hypothetical protein
MEHSRTITGNMCGFRVFLTTDGVGIWVDTVFFDSKMTADEVRKSLINHDGLPENIFVRREK